MQIIKPTRGTVEKIEGDTVWVRLPDGSIITAKTLPMDTWLDKLRRLWRKIRFEE